jgi:protein O-mannosyl-transferase
MSEEDQPDSEQPSMTAGECSEQVPSAAADRVSCRASVSPAAARNALWAAVVSLLLISATAIVFGRTVHHDFINYDDPDYVCHNEHVNKGLTCDGVSWAMTAAYAGNWHPLTWLSHILDCEFYGLRAGGHHLTSALLHAVTAVLLFLVLWKMTADLWPSAFVAAVFAVHPLHVESVAWVAERKDVLSGLFFVLTLAAYLSYVRHRFSLVRYLAVVALFGLGLMTKPMLVTLPFVLLLLDYWPLRRMAADAGERPTEDGSEGDALARACAPVSLKRVGRLVVEKIPLILLTVVSCVVTPWAQGTAVAELADLPLSSRLGNTPVSYVSYLGMSFWPINMAPYYPHPEVGLPAWEPLAALAVLLVITAVVLVRCRKNPCLPVGWFWYLGMLVPVIGLVQVGTQAMADRYMYLPQIGLSIAVTWGALAVVRSWRHRTAVCWVAASAAIAVLVVCGARQASYWRDSETLWRHALACTQRNKLAHFCLGISLAEQGRLQEAAEQYEQAVAIAPDYLDAQTNLGAVLTGLGRTSDAVKHFEKAVAIAPDSMEIRCNLGSALVVAGRRDEAIEYYREALKISPDSVAIRLNLGSALLGGRQLNAAMSEFQRVLKLQPDSAKAHSGCAEVLAKQGKLNDAIEHLEKAVELAPDDAEAHANLGLLLANRDRLEEAIDHYRKALRLAEQQNKKALAESTATEIRMLERFVRPHKSRP